MLVAVAVLRGDAMPANPNLDPEENQGGSLAVGSVIDGTYTILSFVGQGGMGFVYKVEHLMMTKVMALKILRSEQISESVWKRFRTEAQAIARLDHPNVVRIYDMSQTKDGMPFYTMDFLVGKSLAEYLDQNDLLPVADSLPIFRQVCSGLAYAHDRGIVHRDIKPGNIMLIEEAKANLPPLVKIVDFGIAKLSSLDGAAVQGLTRPGEIVGSPLYMSPEQCSGKNLDFRTDMYSVGVTMFQALTGRAPLIGRSAIETISMHQTTVPILMSEAAPDLDFPQQLEEIVARLLAKSSEQRYDSLADVARELLDLERGSSNGLSEGASNLPSKNFVRQIDDSYAGGSTISDTNSMMLKRVKNLCVIFAAVVAPLCLVTADQVLGAFPDWYAKPQPDWPPNTVLTGFPVYDRPEDQTLTPELEAFLRAGEAPVVFTAGSAMAHSKKHFETAVAAAQQTGLRAILVSAFPEQIPQNLPSTIMHVQYAPFSVLFRRACIVQHHGGIGTSIQGLAAGIPQIVTPFAHDQFDNAFRLQRLGVARELNRLNPNQWARTLGELKNSKSVESACRKTKALIDEAAPASAIGADAIEGLA